MTSRSCVEIIEHENFDDAAEVLAEQAGAWLEMCGRGGEVILALPGGRSLGRLFAKLRTHSITWDRITLATNGERDISHDHAFSNMGAVGRVFDRGSGRTEKSVTLDEINAHIRLRTLFDLCIPGIGADGHIASLFQGCPGTEPDGPPIVAVTPSYLAPEARVYRRTLSLSTLAASKLTLLVCVGEEKGCAFEEALSPPSSAPLGLLARRPSGPLTIHEART